MQKLSSAALALFFPLLAVGALVAFGGIGSPLRVPLPLGASIPPTDDQSSREEARAFPAQEAAAVAQAQSEIRLWAARLHASNGADADAARNLSHWRHTLTMRRAKESAARVVLPFTNDAQPSSHL